MIITLFIITLLSLIVFSLHESFGVSNRTGIIVLIWFSQLLAYLRYKNNKEKLIVNRVFFSIQVIVACYTLSAISKIITSGLSWFHSGKLMVLQMIKSNQMDYFDGKLNINKIASHKIQFIIENDLVITILLIGALMIELTSGFGLINKKMRLIYGFLLLFLHIGIYFFLSITIFPFIVPMIIFMINPYYIIINKMRTLRTKIA